MDNLSYIRLKNYWLRLCRLFFISVFLTVILLVLYAFFVIPFNKVESNDNIEIPNKNNIREKRHVHDQNYDKQTKRQIIVIREQQQQNTYINHQPYRDQTGQQNTNQNENYAYAALHDSNHHHLRHYGHRHSNERQPQQQQQREYLTKQPMLVEKPLLKPNNNTKAIHKQRQKSPGLLSHQQFTKRIQQRNGTVANNNKHRPNTNNNNNNNDHLNRANSARNSSSNSRNNKPKINKVNGVKSKLTKQTISRTDDISNEDRDNRRYYNDVGGGNNNFTNQSSSSNYSRNNSNNNQSRARFINAIDNFNGMSTNSSNTGVPCGHRRKNALIRRNNVTIIVEKINELCETCKVVPGAVTRPHKNSPVLSWPPTTTPISRTTTPRPQIWHRGMFFSSCFGYVNKICKKRKENT